MTRLPGALQARKPLTKTDIIEKHITAAIQLMAVEANPYSTHVLVMAADEMILQVAEAKGIALTLDYRIYIKDEYQTEYRRKVREAYNWFKHADRDANASYDGPSFRDLSQVNEVQTLINIRGFREIGGTLTKIQSDYFIFMAVKDPKFLKGEFFDQYPQLRGGFDSLSRDPNVLATALRQIVADAGHLPRD